MFKQILQAFLGFGTIFDKDKKSDIIAIYFLFITFANQLNTY